MKYLKLYENFNNLNDNFWKWFGDSKTIENNEPIKYYHGSENKFKSFDYSTINDDGFHGRGFYFYNNEIAYEYYKNVLMCYLKIEKPYRMNDIVDLETIKIILGDSYNNHKNYIEENIDYDIYYSEIYNLINNDRLIELGYDGIIHGDVAIVFDNKNIKSVVNKGNWDNNTNIYN